MKKYLLIFLFSLLICSPVFATNTYSLDLERGSSQYAYISDANQTGLNVSSFSFEFWYKPDAVPTTDTFIINKGDYDATKESYRVFFTNGGSAEYTFSDSGGRTAGHYISGSSNSALLDNDDVGVWVHFTFTFNISTETLLVYKNSDAAITFTKSGSLGDTLYNDDTPFVIGCRWYAGACLANTYIDGAVDDVRMWSDVRTSQEIADNMEIELVGDETGLVGYWKFNNSATDETANNNDLTLANSPSYLTDVPFLDEDEEEPVIIVSGYGINYLEFFFILILFIIFFLLINLTGTKIVKWFKDKLYDNY